MQFHHDETPKYIKNLRGELNVALKKNMELRCKLEQMEEEQEIGAQSAVIEIGEIFSQKIKEADKTF
jgi:phosphoribosylanthranilate isomerase